MNNDIGKIVSECINNPYIKHYLMKRKDMTYSEKGALEKNFSRVVGYCILFKESEGIEDYMNLKEIEEQKKFIIFRIADKINIPHDKVEENIEEITEYAFDNYVRNGYVFHAGNSRAIEKNMKYGFGPNQSTEDEIKELLEIDSIFKKYDNDNPLGWAIGDIINGNTGWYYSSESKDMLYYSDSPEWFGQFCGCATCYSWGFIPEKSRFGYANRDYEACYMAITKLITKNRMSDEDRKRIIDFFNKCWDRYGDTEPYLAFVPISAIRPEEMLNYMKDYFFPSHKKDKKNDYYHDLFQDIINGKSFMMGNNVCSNEVVPPEELSCVNLSPILPRFNVSEESIERETTILECLNKLNNLDMEYLSKVQEMLKQFPTNNNGRRI